MNDVLTPSELNHHGRHGFRGNDRLPLDTMLPGEGATGQILVWSAGEWVRYDPVIPASAGLRNVLAIDHGETTPTWQADEHEVLSVRHSDTLAGTVVAGDVIVGNATPKWSRLARSVPGAAGLMNVIGLENGETVPSWKAAEHALLSARHSDTLAGTVVRGDIIYGNSTPAWARLAKPSVASFLGHNATDVAWDDGAWTAVSFNAGDFTASAGSWTVASGDLVTLAYRLIGKYMTVAFHVQTSSVSSTPSVLNILIPASKTAARTITNACLSIDAGTAQGGYCFTTASGTNISIGKVNAAAWAVATDTTYVRGEITFETT